MPCISYDGVVVEFEKSLCDFSAMHPEYNIKQYDEVIERKGIEFSEEGFDEVDLREVDAQTMLAMIMTIIRRERFCDGLLLEYLRNGSILKWLERLQAIDEASK